MGDKGGMWSGSDRKTLNIPSSRSTDAGDQELRQEMKSGIEEEVLRRTEPHDDLLKLGRFLIPKTKNPIYIILDSTGSNFKLICEAFYKILMFSGQIIEAGYLDDGRFCICFLYFGDARENSRYPIQIGESADKGAQIDEWYRKFYVQAGAGGNNRIESSELALWAVANMVQLPEDVDNPFCYLITDEAPYEFLRGSEVAKHLGHQTEDMSTSEIFDALMTKFKGNAFIILNDYCNSAGGIANAQIQRAWEDVLGPHRHNLLRLYEMESFMDVMLGTIAVKAGGRTLDEYDKDLVTKDQGKLRRSRVQKTLTPWYQHLKASRQAEGGQGL